MAARRPARLKAGAPRKTAGAGKAGAAGAAPRRDAIGRALQLIELVATERVPLGLAALSERSGLARSTTHRLLAVLEAEGMVSREPGGRAFAPGARLAALSRAALVNPPGRALRHAILEALVRDIGETCNLTVRDGNHVVYLDRVEAQWPMRLVLQPGSRVPMHCTASGKLFLAFMPREQREALLRAAPLERCAAATQTDPDVLALALERIREEELGVDDEEFMDGLVAVSVPVFDATGRLLAGLAVHAPKVRMSLAQARAHVPKLRDAARAVAKTL